LKTGKNTVVIIMLQLEYFKLEIYLHQHQQQLKNINNKTAKRIFQKEVVKIPNNFKALAETGFDVHMIKKGMK
jgi:hypothetical protein